MEKVAEAILLLGEGETVGGVGGEAIGGCSGVFWGRGSAWWRGGAKAHCCPCVQAAGIRNLRNHGK